MLFRPSTAARTSVSAALRTGSRLDLIAARDERVQRKRIAVGNGALFLDEDTEHARFQKG
jgi:hypothetical protein